jgi:error-prone DNA polymerase
VGWNNPPVPWRELRRRMAWRAEGEAPEARAAPPPRRPAPEVPREAAISWAELHCHSSYSFLDGAATPGELVAEAARLGLETLALTDHDGMYGVPQFAQAVAGFRRQGVSLNTVFGAELSLGLKNAQTGVPDPEGRHLLVLARDAEGYRRLCAVISAAQLAGGAKGRPVYDMNALAGAHGGHWVVLTGCRKGPVPAALAAGGPSAAWQELTKLTGMFGHENVMVELTCRHDPGDDERNDLLIRLAALADVGVVATGNVHFAVPGQARLAQALAAIRARSSLKDQDGWLDAAGTAYLRSGQEMAALLRRYPGVLERTAALGRACAFDFRVIAPDLPGRPVPGGHTEASWLRELVARKAPARYGPPGDERVPGAYAQMARELDVIERLNFPGYFLIVHDIVEFCERENILCQGRGSAANSAVCYAIGITNVDPVSHHLLFERFLSEGRDGPPDIDLDIEHRRREEVIQHVYDTYGRDRAAQVANVITYRPRLALRDAGRALGYAPEQSDAWVSQLGPGPQGPQRQELAEIPAPVVELAKRMQRLPRHLGIHSGGMVICDRPVGEVCPVEWARMPGRTVLQWDKDDCAYAGLVKFDLLGLGMLAALHDCFDLVEKHHGVRWTMATIPQEDPVVYQMLCEADTVGVFQVESRAQMATLPRLRPRQFYDLVIEVALIRPGPIQGGSVHPYLRRRDGLEDAAMPHESMRAALGKTLGVPLFQEQMMQLAIDCAGFDPAEADRLRQAMSAKRAPERIKELHDRLLGGMAERGINADVASDIYAKILAFSSYGFPESHAISFAYLVYASAWLKRYYPAAFTAALLRNQPMGFYAPHSLVNDARRHGVEVRGVDVNASDALATLENARENARENDREGDRDSPAIRLGLAEVRTLGTQAAERVVAGRVATGPYRDLADFAARTGLPAATLEALAIAGAFGCFGLSRRAALWAAGPAATVREGQLPGTTPGNAPPLPAMTPSEETLADLWATGTYGTHPLAHIRAGLAARRVLTAAAVRASPEANPEANHEASPEANHEASPEANHQDADVTVAGLVTHRQQPPTARGVVFLSLEDETGMVNVICPPHVWARHRRIAAAAPALLVSGRVERTGGAVNLVATALRPIRAAATTRRIDAITLCGRMTTDSLTPTSPTEAAEGSSGQTARNRPFTPTNIGVHNGCVPRFARLCARRHPDRARHARLRPALTQGGLPGRVRASHGCPDPAALVLAVMTSRRRRASLVAPWGLAAPGDIRSPGPKGRGVPALSRWGRDPRFL